MRTINFSEEDIKQCKLALTKQSLTPLQSAFLMQYITNIEQKNKQLKHNWNYIKKMLKEARQKNFNINGYCGTCTDVDIDLLLNKMKELEQGSEN